MNNLDTLVIKDKYNHVTIDGHTVTYDSKIIRNKIELLLKTSNGIILPKEYTYVAVGDDVENSVFKIVLKNKDTVMCNECNTEMPMQWDKFEIILNDKKGTVKELNFMYCDDCGSVRHVELS